MKDHFLKTIIGVFSLAFFLGTAGIWPVLLAAEGALVQHPLTAEDNEFQDLPSAGKKCWLDETTYFVYEFTEKPQMGTAILRIQVFNKSGEKNSSFKIMGRYDMPSMAGAHDSGDQEFKLNKKNDYLLPVSIVMPGEWKVKVTFLKEESPRFRGRFKFNV